MSDRQISLEERYTEVENLIKGAEGEIDYFEQEIEAINDNTEKIKRTFKHWGNEHEINEYVAKLNIAKEVYQYLVEGWHGEIDDLKSELYRLEETL